MYNCVSTFLQGCEVHARFVVWNEGRRHVQSVDAFAVEDFLVEFQGGLLGRFLVLVEKLSDGTVAVVDNLDLGRGAGVGNGLLQFLLVGYPALGKINQRHAVHVAEEQLGGAPDFNVMIWLNNITRLVK